MEVNLQLIGRMQNTVLQDVGKQHVEQRSKTESADVSGQLLEYNGKLYTMKLF